MSSKSVLNLDCEPSGSCRLLRMHRRVIERGGYWLSPLVFTDHSLSKGKSPFLLFLFFQIFFICVGRHACVCRYTHVQMCIHVETRGQYGVPFLISHTLFLRLSLSVAKCSLNRLSWLDSGSHKSALSTIPGGLFFGFFSLRVRCCGYLF